MTQVLVSGSVSYDTLLTSTQHFPSLIDDRATDVLSVGLLFETLHTAYGGPAANMAFHLRQLGVSATPIAAVGDDFQPYANWLDRHGIDRRGLLIVPGERTARAFIQTDRQQNQIVGFFGGAMSCAADCRVPECSAELCVVGPDDRSALLKRLADFGKRDCAILFDPGQCVTSLERADLAHAIDVSDWMIVNEFEAHFVARRLDTGVEKLAARLDALIVTRGANGSRLYRGCRTDDVPAVAVKHPVDPTGCGDAYRAGVVAGLLDGMDVTDAMAQGADRAARTLEHIGAQGQTVDSLAQ